MAQRIAETVGLLCLPARLLACPGMERVIAAALRCRERSAKGFGRLTGQRMLAQQSAGLERRSDLVEDATRDRELSGGRFARGRARPNDRRWTRAPAGRAALE